MDTKSPQKQNFCNSYCYHIFIIVMMLSEATKLGAWVTERISTSQNISTSEPWAFSLGRHLSNRTIFSCRKGSNFPHLKEKNHFSCRKHQASRRHTKDDALELLQDSNETANTAVRTTVGEGRCWWNRWDAQQTQKFTSHVVLHIFTHYWNKRIMKMYSKTKTEFYTPNIIFRIFWFI